MNSTLVWIALRRVLVPFVDRWEEHKALARYDLRFPRWYRIKFRIGQVVAVLFIILVVLAVIGVVAGLTIHLTGVGR